MPQLSTESTPMKQNVLETNQLLYLFSAIQQYCYRAIVMDFYLHILLKAPGFHLQSGGASLLHKLPK